MTDPDENQNWGQGATLCGHSLASEPTCQAFQEHCLGSNGPDESCTVAQAQVVTEAGGVDTYGMDYPTCTHGPQLRASLHHTYPTKKHAPGFPNKFKSQPS